MYTHGDVINIEGLTDLSLQSLLYKLHNCKLKFIIKDGSLLVLNKPLQVHYDMLITYLTKVHKHADEDLSFLPIIIEYLKIMARS